jgi:DNA-binding MarR family transcriptional regulator
MTPEPPPTPSAAGQALPGLLLAAAAALVDAIHEGVVAEGFTDMRPTHGFVFVRLAPDGATVGQVAAHLGVTKQAASQLVEELEQKGYVRRGPHPRDARARLVTLTERGWACTRAADRAAARAIAAWGEVLGAAEIERMVADLALVAPPGRVRPAVW